VYRGKNTEINLQTNQLSVLPEKLTVFHPVKKFLSFCGTRRFITAFTTARYLSYPEPDRASPCSPSSPSRFSKVRFNITLPTTPGSSKWSPSFRLLHWNSVRTSSLPHTYYMPCPSKSTWLDKNSGIMSWNKVLRSCFIAVVYPSLSNCFKYLVLKHCENRVYGKWNAPSAATFHPYKTRTQHCISLRTV
jgi:hypothetical protein